MNNLYDNQNNDLINLINILSFMVGLENMQENRQQSQYNDVHKANDEQAKLLLKEINERFEKQNIILREHTALLTEILDILRKDSGL